MRHIPHPNALRFASIGFTIAKPPAVGYFQSLSPYLSFLYISTSPECSETAVSSSSRTETFKITISTEESGCWISNFTLPSFRRAYFPLTAIPSLSTALNELSFKNSNIAVLPTSRHVPVKCDAFAQPMSRTQTRIVNRERVVDFSMRNFMGLLTYASASCSKRRSRKRTRLPMQMKLDNIMPTM